MKKIVSTILAATLAFTVSACDNGNVVSPESVANGSEQQALAMSGEDHEAQVNETLEILQNASSIRLKKDFISWGDHWTVYADGEVVGNVHGRPIRMLEVYEFTNTNGVLIASEEENWKIVNATANLKDWQGNQIGRIEQEIFTMLAKLRIYRGDKQVGAIDQKFDFGMNAQIVGTSNLPQWNLKGKVFTMGADLTLTRATDDASITPMEAIWSSLILYEITSSDSSSSSSKNSSK